MAGISGKTIGRGSRKRLTTSNIRINGQVLNKKSDAQKSKILTATRALAANGVATPIVQFSETETSLESLNLLEAMGYTVLDNYDADYSLLNVQTDTETIENPNIQTEISSGPTAGISAKTSFPNKDDPFYDVDTGTSTTEDSERSLIKKLRTGEKTITLSADIATVNLSSKISSTTKSFQKAESNSSSSKMKKTSYK